MNWFCHLCRKEQEVKIQKNAIIRKSSKYFELTQNVKVQIKQLDYYNRNSIKQIYKSSIVSAGEIRVIFKKVQEHQQEEHHQYSENSSISSNRDRKSTVNRNSEGSVEIGVRIEDKKYREKQYNFLHQLQQLKQWIKNPATQPEITKIRLDVEVKLKQYTFLILEQALQMLSSLTIVNNRKFKIIIYTCSEEQTNKILYICKKIKDNQLVPSSIFFSNQANNHKNTLLQS